MIEFYKDTIIHYPLCDDGSVATESLKFCLFNVWFILSIFPLDCGLQGVWKSQFIYKILLTCWLFLLQNVVPYQKTCQLVPQTLI